MRLIKPGHTNNEVTEVIQKVANAYDVNPVEGVLSHELKKHLIDGNKVIINKETFEQRVDAQEFAVNDVIALDVFVSSGEGKTKEMDTRCTVYKRALDRTYNLKIKQSRQFFNEVLDNYPSFCFGLNSFKDPITARIGIKECLEHELLVPYPALTEKQGTFVAQFKITAMITKGKTTALTGLPVDEALFKTDNAIKDEKVLELLAVLIGLLRHRCRKRRRKPNDLYLVFNFLPSLPITISPGAALMGFWVALLQISKSNQSSIYRFKCEIMWIYNKCNVAGGGQGWQLGGGRGGERVGEGQGVIGRSGGVRWD